MSLLTLMSTVADEIGVQRPTSGIVGTADQQVRQMTALLVRSATELLRAYDWQFFTVPYTLVTVPGQASYPFPTDTPFLRFVDETQWLTSSKTPLSGPLSAREWATAQWGVSLSGVYYRYQVRQGQIFLMPTPASVSTINFFYITNTWVNVAGDPAQPSAVLKGDNDTFNFPEDLLIAATKWRFLRAKKLDYDEEQETYRTLLYVLVAQDKPGRTLSMDPDTAVGSLYPNGTIVIPVTGYGGVS